MTPASAALQRFGPPVSWRPSTARPRRTTPTVSSRASRSGSRRWRSLKRRGSQPCAARCEMQSMKPLGALRMTRTQPADRPPVPLRQFPPRLRFLRVPIRRGRAAAFQQREERARFHNPGTLATRQPSANNRVQHLRHSSRALVALALTLTIAAAGCGEATSDKGPARVEITSPADNSTARKRTVTIRGTVSPPDEKLVEVSIDGRSKTYVSVTDGEWSTKLALSTGSHEITAKAGDSDSTITVARELTRAQRAAARERARIRAERAVERREEGRQTFINEAQPVDYGQLKKDADSFAGDKVKVYGQIFQIQQEGDLGGVVLVAVTNEGYDIWDDNVWVNYKGRIEGAEDDLITIYGVVDGEREYETQIGGQTYVPEVTAKYIEEE